MAEDDLDDLGLDDPVCHLDRHRDWGQGELQGALARPSLQPAMSTMG